MAITLDALVGSTIGLTTGFSGVATMSTTNAAAAGSRVVVTYSFFANNVPAPTCTIGGVSATRDKFVSNGSDFFAVFSLVVAGGLASSSSIVCSPAGTSNANGGGLSCACSYLGITAVDTNSNNTTTGTGFSSGAALNAVADSLFVGGAGNETLATSVGTVNTNGTPRFDIWNSAAQQGMRMLDVISSSIGSQALTGSWGPTGTQSSTATTGGLVIYKGTAVAAPAVATGPPVSLGSYYYQQNR